MRYMPIILTCLVLFGGTTAQAENNSNVGKDVGATRERLPADPPRETTSSGGNSTKYTRTDTHPSPVQSGGGSSTTHDYNRKYDVPSPGK
jgi:hypothetical protein